jgi:hypothetical protein
LGDGPADAPPDVLEVSPDPAVVDPDAVVPGSVSPDVAAPPASPADPSPASVGPFAVTLARRSFLAQPEPLKWTAGAAMALRTGPEPHKGQAVGGSAWTPWMTSKRRPQAAHT